MSTNRFVTTNNTLNRDALREEKFGGAMLTGATAASVGAVSVESMANTPCLTYKTWEENLSIAMHFLSDSDYDPFTAKTGRVSLKMNMRDIPNFIALLQKTYDGMSALDKEVKEAYEIIKKASM